MKTFKLRLAALTLAAAAILGFLFSACQKEELPEPASLIHSSEASALFTREVTVTDASGMNSALLKFSSSDKHLLEEVSNSSMTIKPMFENKTPDGSTQSEGVQSSAQIVEETPPIEAKEDDSDTIFVEILPLRMAPGVVGLNLVYLDNQPHEPGAVSERTHGNVTFIHDTVADAIRVTALNGHYRVTYWRKPTSTSAWYFIGGYAQINAPHWSQGWACSSASMRAIVKRAANHVHSPFPINACPPPMN